MAGDQVTFTPGSLILGVQAVNEYEQSLRSVAAATRGIRAQIGNTRGWEGRASNSINYLNMSVAQLSSVANSLDHIRAELDRYVSTAHGYVQEDRQAALVFGAMNVGSIPTEAYLVPYDAAIGPWSEHGEKRYGAKLRLGTSKVVIKGSTHPIEWSGPSAKLGEISVGSDGLTVDTPGIEFTKIESKGVADPWSNRDEILDFGISGGPPGHRFPISAARLHWGDSDKDGYHEFGFGADFHLLGLGLSFDIKTEDPLRTILRAKYGGLSDAILPNGNVTGMTVDAVGHTVKMVAERGAKVWDVIATTAGNIWDGALNLVAGPVQ